MHEDFVTMDQAQLLKELGFDYQTDNVWMVIKNEKYFITTQEFNGMGLNKFCSDFYLAPTLSQVQKWFREVHGIDIDIDSVYHRLDTGNKVMYGLRIGIKKHLKKNSI